MARKKRLQEIKEIPQPEQPKESVVYQDVFQQTASRRITDLSKKVEGKGRTILYALLAALIVGILLGLIYRWNQRSSAAGQTALGKALETWQAPVTSQPVPPTFTGKSFKTEKERAQAAVTEFEAVANTYGGEIANKAKYFAAVSKMSIDRNAAIQEFESLSKTVGDVGYLAKFALAQAKQGDGKFDEAAALYQELGSADQSVVAMDSINFALALIYEKQGKKAEAADLYFKIADAASKAKDLDGKTIPMSQTATEAKEKLQALDPAKAAQIKVETPSMPS